MVSWIWSYVILSCISGMNGKWCDRRLTWARCAWAISSTSWRVGQAFLSPSSSWPANNIGDENIYRLYWHHNIGHMPNLLLLKLSCVISTASMPTFKYSFDIFQERGCWESEIIWMLMTGSATWAGPVPLTSSMRFLKILSSGFSGQWSGLFFLWTVFPYSCMSG